MKREIAKGWVGVFLVAGLVLSTGGIVAEIPPPRFEGVAVACQATWKADTGQYGLFYTLTNPSENTLAVALFYFEKTDARETMFLDAPKGWNVDTYFKQVRVGDNVLWGTMGEENPLSPGRTVGGFGLFMTSPPSIRELTIEPDIYFTYLYPLYEELEAQGKDLTDAEWIALEHSYFWKVWTLGPLSVPPGTFEHWNVFLSDVEKAGTLGWIAGAGLLSGIGENLSAARQAALSGDLQAVNGKLDRVIGAAEGASETQMRREAKDLIVLNARYLKANLPWPCEPKLALEPEAAVHPVGETAVVAARLVNTATGLPIANNALTVEVVEGPHGGTKREGVTDAEGKVVLSYTGTRLGEDKVVARTPFGTIAAGGEKGSKAPSRASTGSRPKGGTAEECRAWDLEKGPVTVKWEGGPDLMVPLFVPPVLMSGPGRTFYVTEATRNGGTLPAGPSVTRYYLSTARPVEPSSAVAVGQRSLPALAPGEESQVTEVPFTVPESLPAGTYYLEACADAEGAVAETNEGNNCSSSQLSLLVGVMP